MSGLEPQRKDLTLPAGPHSTFNNKGKEEPPNSTVSQWPLPPRRKCNLVTASCLSDSPRFSVETSIPKAKLNNCTVAAITTSTAHEEGKHWALLKFYWGQQAVLLTWNMSHCRCWCHFFYGSGMARSRCLNSLQGKNNHQEVWERKGCNFNKQTMLIKIPQLAMTFYRFIACVLSPPLLCFIALCISDTPISPTGPGAQCSAAGEARHQALLTPAPTAVPPITVQGRPLACASGNSRREFLR